MSTFALIVCVWELSCGGTMCAMRSSCRIDSHFMSSYLYSLSQGIALRWTQHPIPIYAGLARHTEGARGIGRH